MLNTSISTKKKYKERQYNGFYPDKKEENKSWFKNRQINKSIYFHEILSIKKGVWWTVSTSMAPEQYHSRQNYFKRQSLFVLFLNESTIIYT